VSSTDNVIRALQARGKMALWPDEMKPGSWWTCKECGDVSELQLGVVVKGAPDRCYPDLTPKCPK